MLSPDEQALLRAVIDRLLPADDFPAASGFGADVYILAMLDGDAAPVREMIRYGLAELDRQGYRQLDAAGQDRMLKAAEGEPWFARLVDLTAEGTYADPGNGGNRDAASWRMLGYEHCACRTVRMARRGSRTQSRGSTDHPALPTGT